MAIVTAASITTDAIRRARAMKDGTVIVALDGHSAAGKSTLAATLVELTGAAVVHGDDFYRDMPEGKRLTLSPREGVERYFDWERLRDEALGPLLIGERATFRCFDWAQGRGLTAARATVAPSEVVIIEGVYSARTELADLLDLTVLVEASDEERQRRRRARHDPNGWEERWDAAERLYFDSIRPASSFDLVVSGRGPDRVVLNQPYKAE